MWAKKLIFAMILTAQLSGCTSVFNSTEQLVTVTCLNPDCNIFINKIKYVNQAKVSLPRNEYVHILINKEGYTPYKTTITTALSGCGVTDAISGMFLLLPAFGLLSPGAYELTRTDLTVKLYEAN